jgi:hypothetical protein
MPDPFAVDVDRTLDALVSAWGLAGYDQIWHHEGTGWGAAHKDAGDLQVIEADTPDELDARIRADWQRRSGQGSRADPGDVSRKFPRPGTR